MWLRSVSISLMLADEALKRSTHPSQDVFLPLSDNFVPVRWP